MHNTSHYGEAIECIDAMEQIYGREAVKHFCICNAFKYLWRCEKKGQYISDIDKAIDYLVYVKEIIEEEQEENGTV